MNHEALQKQFPALYASVFGTPKSNISPLAIAAMRALDNGAQIGGGITPPGVAMRAAIRQGIERDAPIIAARNARIEAEQRPLREEIERITRRNSSGRGAELEAENARLRATIAAMAGRN